MKSYKSLTKNRGTTIILDSVAEAIEIGNNCPKHLQNWGGFTYYDSSSKWEDCIEAIQKGDLNFKKLVEETIDDLTGLVDNMEPKFSQQHSGFKLSEEGFTSTPDLIATGEELCTLERNVTPFKLKKGSGDGAYRVIINTDVHWYGTPEDNCALVGCLITMLQRYAPVEVWIQQGWLGNNEKDGVTLFKLDFTAGMDITNLAFWINHRGKDIPFSHRINRALGRVSSATSCYSEIEADLMCRGDWMMQVFEVTKDNRSMWQYKNFLYTDRLDIMAKWITMTSMEILEDKNNGSEIHE